MDLSVQSSDNIQFMIDEITKKLRMATGGMMKPEHFDINQYEQIREIYDLIMNKQSISISEMEAIATELGKMRAT